MNIILTDIENLLAKHNGAAAHQLWQDLNELLTGHKARVEATTVPLPAASATPAATPPVYAEAEPNPSSRPPTGEPAPVAPEPVTATPTPAPAPAPVEPTIPTT